MNNEKTEDDGLQKLSENRSEFYTPRYRSYDRHFPGICRCPFIPCNGKIVGRKHTGH